MSKKDRFAVTRQNRAQAKALRRKTRKRKSPRTAIHVHVA
jgi:hypothetical protein